MKPNKLHIVFKIFGFLILSIGILYICQFFTKTFEEGFQSAPSSRYDNIANAKCTLESDNNRDIILCPDTNAVDRIMKNISINLPKESDNVCILTGDPSKKYYTCYTRPIQQEFDETYGVYRDFDPIIDEDNLAFDLVPSIDTFCASYITNTTKINRGIQSTQMVYNRVVAIVISSTKYMNELSILKQRYCNPILPDMDDACNNISNSYDYLNTILNGSKDFENFGIAKVAISNSINTLSNISTATFAQYGSICKESPKYSLAYFIDVVEPTPVLT